MGHYSNLFLIIILVGVFYALMILPQRKQQKKRTEMMRRLTPGSKILTAGGMYAQIVSVHDDVLLVKIAPEVEIEIDQRAVMRVIESAPAVEGTPDNA